MEKRKIKSIIHKIELSSIDNDVLDVLAVQKMRLNLIETTQKEELDRKNIILKDISDQINNIYNDGLEADSNTAHLKTNISCAIQVIVPTVVFGSLFYFFPVIASIVGLLCLLLLVGYIIIENY